MERSKQTGPFPYPTVLPPLLMRAPPSLHPLVRRRTPPRTFQPCHFSYSATDSRRYHEEHLSLFCILFSECCIYSTYIHIYKRMLTFLLVFVLYILIMRYAIEDCRRLLHQQQIGNLFNKIQLINAINLFNFETEELFQPLAFYSTQSSSYQHLLQDLSFSTRNCSFFSVKVFGKLP